MRTQNTSESRTSHRASRRGVVGGVRVLCLVVACGAMVAATGTSWAEEGPKKSSQQSKQRSAKPAKRPAARPASRPAKKQAARPAPKRAAPKRASVQPKPKSRPKAQPTRRPTRQPAAKPSRRPSTRPSAQPAKRPTRQPATSPSRRPSTQPATRPATRPATQPKPAPTKQNGVTTTRRPSRTPATRPSTQPTTRPAQEFVPTRPAKNATGSKLGATNTPGSTGLSSTGQTPIAVSNGSGKKSVRRLDAMAKSNGIKVDSSRPVTTSVGPGNPGAGKSLVTKGSVPSGFDPENAVGRGGGKSMGSLDGATEIGPGGDPIDDGIHDDGIHDDDHDDYHDGYDDGYHDGHDDSHHKSWCKGCSYCNNSWYFVINDYDGDGYYDYACTNANYTIWWYGGYGYGYGYSSYGYGYGYPGYYYGRPYWYNRYQYYRGPVYGPDVELNITIETSVDEPAPEAGTYSMSAIEVARMLMGAGASDDAMDAYTAHLDEYPDDWGAVRELGIAKILGRQYVDGVALVHYAYSSDPSLAGDRLSPVLFENSREVMRSAVVDLVRWGHRNPSAGAWLTVASLMQGEERDAVAMNMLDRASGHGLDPAIGDAMRAELVRH